MFIDELTLYISAGRGGDGIVAWKHEKGRDHAGPGGGDGGRGGDVYLSGTPDINQLSEYRFEKEFKAENGQRGLNKEKFGHSGKDITILLPFGTVVTNIENGEQVEIMNDQPVFFLRGGLGGHGNAFFKSSKNQNPMMATEGREGQSGSFKVELKLVAKVGLIGLPNAGKSSLLNALTNSRAKVGNYQFTTLEPNLGNLYGIIIADIPGLIEGASEGKGLGDKFLRHISRTQILVHCISSENENIDESYKVVRNELKSFDKELLQKEEIILLTKTDAISDKDLKKKIKKLAKTKKEIFTISIIDEKLIKEFSNMLIKKLQNEKL